MSSQSSTWQADVVVVGAGAGGCAAALEAARYGARVLVVEKATKARAGGNTRVAGGVWFEHDNPDRAASYLRALSGEHGVDPRTTSVWATETAGNSAWIRSIGGDVQALSYHLDPEFPELEGSDCYLGFRSVDGAWGGGHLHRFLLTALDDADVDIRFACPATGLVVDDAGEVTGVDVDDRAAGPQRIESGGGVVIATGGFENSDDMVRQHLGLPGAVPWGSPENTGDGHRMAVEAGAGLSNMDNYMPILGLRAPGYEAGFPVHFPPGSGFIYVNELGRRFVDEVARNRHGHVYEGGRYRLALEAPCWAIFDERGRRGGPLSQPYAGAPFGWNNLQGAHVWSEDNQAEIDAGWIQAAGSVSDLAESIGVDGRELMATIDSYNAAHRDDPHRPALDQPPFYAFEWGPLVAYTCGGPRRNEHAQVLDPEAQPIPGLYCAGEVSSTYRFCMDGGMMIGDALAFGRVAGRSAATRSR